MVEDLIIPVIFCIASIVCLMFFIRSAEDDVMGISLRTIVLGILTLGIVISGFAYKQYRSDKVREELICTITEKAKIYSVYIDGNEVLFENIHIEDYLPDVFIDDENKKILLAAK